MRQKTAVSMMVAAVCAVVVLFGFINSSYRSGASRQDESTTPLAEIVTFDAIVSAEDLANALRYERLILHFDADWSMYSLLSRPVIVSFKQAIEMDVGFRDVKFRRVDCTELDDPVQDAVKEWLESQNAQFDPISSGYGAIVWVASGKVVEIVPYPAEESVDNLVTRTRLKMPSHTQPHRAATTELQNNAVSPSGGSGGF
jgi:hypothetical protein